jgi:hypothetical protein
VPAGEQSDQQLLDHLVLPDDDPPQLDPDPVRPFAQALHRFNVSPATYR